MALTKLWLLCGLVAVGGCSTAQRAQENTAVQKEAAREVARICSLPEPARSVEIEKLRKESGIAVLCGAQ